jgi:predicted regulator of Ras-like GTPase activity (Roadblock/LC7/MglB family)
MDPAEALTDLKQISTQVERAVVVRNDGTLEASTLRDGAAAQRIARGAADLWEAAEAARSSLGRPPLSQLEVATPDGSVFAVRDDARMVCAVTGGDPTVGLIFYDLKTCLRNIAEEPVEAVPDVPPEPVAAEPPATAGEEEPDGQG